MIQRLLILILFFASCLSEEKSQPNIERSESKIHVDENDVKFSLFETYSDTSGYYSIAYGYLRTCNKLHLMENSTLRFNDTLMEGELYACNYLKNNKALTKLQCDSIYIYKFCFEQISLLDYELLNFLENYSDSIITLNLDGNEVYRDTLNKTSIILDAPILGSMLEGCY